MASPTPEWISSVQPSLQSRQGPLSAALCLIVLALALYATSGAGYFATQNYSDFLQHGYDTGIGEEEGNSLSVIGTIASVLMVLSLIVSPPRIFNVFVAAFLSFQIWFAITTLWSASIFSSIVIILKTIIYITAVLGLMKWMAFRDVIRALSVTIFVVCTVSLYLCFTDPIFRISLGADGWRGLFAQKNGFAAFSAFSLFLVYPALFRSDTRKFALLTIPLLVACIVLSQGKTALILSILYIALATPLFFYIGSGRRLKDNLYIVSIILALSLIIAAVIAGVAIYAGWIDFTGRVPIWARAISTLGDKFAFGVGGTGLGDTDIIAKNTNAEGAIVFDSSYILILYNQGLIGVLWYLSVIVVIWVNIVRNGSRHAVFSIVTLIGYIIYAVFEAGARLNLSYPSMILLLQCCLSQDWARIDRDEDGNAGYGASWTGG